MYPEEYGAVAECFRKANQPECTAVAKPFPKGICEPARRKILDQAKFLSKGRFMGYWGKAKRSCININFNIFFRRNVADIDYDISLF